MLVERDAAAVRFGAKLDDVTREFANQVLPSTQAGNAKTCPSAAGRATVQLTSK